MVVIPFAEFPAFTQEIILDNIPFRFTFNWNTRGEYWSMSIADRDLTPLISGLKVVIDFLLLSKFSGRNLPPGEIFAIDPSNQIIRIGRNDFQDKVSLIYLTEEDTGALI